MVEDALRRAAAEFVGAFALIFIGAGSIVTANAIHDPSLIGVAIAHGVTIAVMVSAVGHISGGHFNPAITVDILFGGPLTGAAMNPARAFGPQLVGSHWSHAWVWYAGPVLGAAVAAALYELLYLRPAKPEPVGPADSGVIEPRAGEPA